MTMQGTCTGCCGGGPPNWSSRTIGIRVVESLWEGKRGRAKQTGGVEERGRGVPAPVGSISVCRAVGKSLDLFRCANIQKDPI